MHCTQCNQNFQDRKALLCHMNHPFWGCHSHFQEVADLAEELQRYKNQPAQNENPPTQNENDNSIQLMDLEPEMDVDAMSMEPDNSGGNDWSMHGGAAKEYGTSTTFMREFDGDQYAGERITNLYYPFVSRHEWEFAAFLLHSNLSMASIDSLLLLNLVSVTCNFDCSYSCSAQVKGLNLSFSTVKRL
ncbi:hypothetical protein L208DRAFT_1266729 [Tricholoma matsutake]|nr:hypothetical protein L208DRAFT_1266729 [Tricholoma matsutake 945]